MQLSDMPRTRRRFARKGFTLVEVIVVLVILAILAAIMIPAMTGWIDKSREKRAVIGCRTCVTAAQTLASEQYAIVGAGNVTLEPAEVLALAKLGGTGTVNSVTVGAPAVVDELIYTETATGVQVTYHRLPEPQYTFGTAQVSAPAWEEGKSYRVGDTIQASGYVFQCVKDHDSGTSQYTRAPDAGAGNKTRWIVLSTADGSIPSYSKNYAYFPGVVVEYTDTVKNITYLCTRTDKTPLSSSPTPSATGGYWDMQVKP